MVGPDGYRHGMTSNRSRLAVREGTTPAVAQEGVPASLEPALRAWIWETISLAPNEAERIMIRLDLELPETYWNRYERELKETKAEQARQDAEWEEKRAKREKAAEAKPSNNLVATMPTYVAREIAAAPPNPYAEYLADGTDTAVLWDVVDDLLYALCIEPPLPGATWTATLGKRSALKRTTKIVSLLQALLEDSRSVYEVRADRRGLQRRVDAILAEALNLAGQGAETAGHPQARLLLDKARRMLLDRRPDPSGAYVEVLSAYLCSSMSLIHTSTCTSKRSIGVSSC